MSVNDKASIFGGSRPRSKSRSRKSSAGEVGSPMIKTAVEAKLVEGQENIILLVRTATFTVTLLYHELINSF